MPTLKAPDNDVALASSSAGHNGSTAVGTHIYLALAVVAVLVVTRLIKSRPSQPPAYGDYRADAKEKDQGQDSRKDSTASYSGKRGPTPQATHQRPPVPGYCPSSDREPQQALWPAGLLPLAVKQGQPAPLGPSPTMDDSHDHQWKDHSGSASASSRGVSTSALSELDFTQPPPQHAHLPVGPALSAPSRTRASRSPPQWSPEFLSRRQSENSDGPESQRSKGKGKGPMASQGSWGESHAHAGTDDMAFGSDLAQVGSAQEVRFSDVDYTASPRFSRPPPPPPLTAPTLSNAGFPFEARRPSYSISEPPELDHSFSFISQPNADYVSMSTSTDVLSSSPQSTTTSRRRSYTKQVPVGIPIPTTSASSSSETTTSSGTFSPSSYPPTSPLLPPPPPGHELPSSYEFVGGPGGPGILLSEQEIDLHGEIVSVMDDAGHGWKRHTRVYGGGVCLACLAAGDQGGFYGATVPLEDRR